MNERRQPTIKDYDTDPISFLSDIFGIEIQEIQEITEGEYVFGFCIDPLSPYYEASLTRENLVTPAKFRKKILEETGYMISIDKKQPWERIANVITKQCRYYYD